jgi:hypothetical protein
MVNKRVVHCLESGVGIFLLKHYGEDPVSCIHIMYILVAVKCMLQRCVITLIRRSMMSSKVYAWSEQCYDGMMVFII